MIKKFLCVIIFLFSCSTVSALELMLGGGILAKSIVINDTEFGRDNIAELNSGQELSPIISIRSHPNYFNDIINWAYHFEIGASSFNIDKQQVDGINKEFDIGTKMSGYSIYAMPLLYYHFNRKNNLGWQYKAGLGIGIGYLNMNGNFIITDKGHPNYRQNKKIAIDEINSSVGAYFEAAYGNHAFTLRNYATTGNDGNFKVSQNNVLMAYQYVFDLIPL